MTHSGAEKIEFSRPGDLPGVEVLLAEHSSRRWRWFHATYTVCTVLNGFGSTEWAYRGRRHEATPGEVLLFEPGEVHFNTNILADATFRVLFIAPSLVGAAAAELSISPLQPHWKLTHTPKAALYRALARLHRSIENGGTRLEVESRFAGCLRRLLAQCTETGTDAESRPPHRNSLLRTRDFLHENYCRQIALEELSAVSGLSRFHLAHAFAAQFGLPPHAYQIHLRIQKARSLLAASNRPASVSAELGFSDQSHFARHFRNITHTTPGRYVRMIRLP